MWSKQQRRKQEMKGWENCLPFDLQELNAIINWIDDEVYQQPSLQSFQIMKSESGQQQSGSKGLQTSRDSYVIHRIIYASILVAFLLLISFYFDLLQDYDALSLVLGFVACIILQFSFLSYYFRHEMNKYKIDEIGVLKWKIKLIFGEHDPKHIRKKNRMKYYRHQPNEGDRLFSRDNQQIYENVMSHLRGKEEPNFTEMIAKTRIKWTFLEDKVLLLEKFLAAMLKQYDQRKNIYNRYKSKAKERKELREWEELLKEDEKKHEGGEGSPRGGAKVRLDWQIFNWFMLEKAKLNQKELNCLKENIVREYGVYIRNIKEAKESHSRARDKLLANLKGAREEKAQIVREIERISIKYSQIKEALESNRIKQEEDVEAILKKEFDLRLQKIELENYEIKISRAQSLILCASQQLHAHLQQEEMELEDHLNKLNSKFTNYLNMMAGIGDSRTPIVNKYLDEDPLPYLDSPAADSEFEALLQKCSNRRKNELSFKNYLAEVVALFKQIGNHHNETNSLIQQYKPKFQRSSDQTTSQSRLKKEMTGARLHYYASNVKDLKILKMFEKLNSFECKLAEQVGQYLLRQSRLLGSFEEQVGASFSRELKKSQEEVRRREEEIKKSRRRYGKEEGDAAVCKEMAELNVMKSEMSAQINDYLSGSRIFTCLLDIVEAMAQNESSYERYANELAEQEQFERSNEKVDNEDSRARQRHTAYLNCIQKQSNLQFDDDTLEKEDYFQLDKEREEHNAKSKNEVEIWSFTNYSLRDSLSKQKSKEALKMIQLSTFSESSARSIEILNRLLGVLFNEWSKSEFFHEFIKELLTTSLNAKKPDIVEHLNLQYFKIVERDKSVGPIKNIKVHQSEIFRCLFDLHLDFKGKIAVQIGSRLKIGKKPILQIKLLIKQFQCPIRICFTPYSLGKSYASLLERPKLSIEYSVSLGGFYLTKIPFFSQIIKTYIVLKLRKKMMWPKRMTLPVPLAYKSTLDLAIAQRNKFEREKEKLQKKSR